MKKAALISALVPALLSACAAGPDYKRPTVDTPAAFKELGDWKPAEPREPLAADNWWAVFGDPVLDDLQARLEVSNQNLRAAEAAYRQALALADAARASWFPAINATAGATRSATSAATAASGNAPPRNSFSLGATVSWELDVWGRIARTVEGVDASLAASAASSDRIPASPITSPGPMRPASILRPSLVSITDTTPDSTINRWSLTSPAGRITSPAR